MQTRRCLPAHLSSSSECKLAEGIYKMQASARAIRRHAIVDLLDQPGTADLSVHVDFDALRSGSDDACCGVGIVQR